MRSIKQELDTCKAMQLAVRYLHRIWRRKAGFALAACVLLDPATDAVTGAGEVALACCSASLATFGAPGDLSL